LSGVDGISKHPNDKIECEFNDRSVDFKVHDFKGGNFRLRLSPLNDIIDISKSKFKLKSNSVTIELHKKEKKYWGDIKPKGN
jgi:hypothetical protein